MTPLLCPLSSLPSPWSHVCVRVWVYESISSHIASFSFPFSSSWQWGELFICHIPSSPRMTTPYSLDSGMSKIAIHPPPHPGSNAFSKKKKEKNKASGACVLSHLSLSACLSPRSCLCASLDTPPPLAQQHGEGQWVLTSTHKRF